MQHSYQTDRLVLTAITLEDAEFLAELVHTPEWLEWVGNRDISPQEDAGANIRRIQANPDNRFWVVRLANKQTPIGVVTFVKRDYLDHSDIGFVFLPNFTSQGYAREAATAVLNEIMGHPVHPHVLAITAGINIKAIELLKELGFQLEQEMDHGNGVIGVYGVSASHFFIHQVTDLFFSVFTNADRQVPALDKLYAICLPDVLIIRKTKETETIFDLASFIEPRKRILSDGTLTGFREYQTFEETRVIGHLAQRFSTYKKRGYLNGEYFEANGHKLFQYVQTGKGWKIASVMWEDEPG